MILDLIDIKETDEEKKEKEDDIAIIGIGMELPFSKNLEELWVHLACGDDLITSISEMRKKDILDYQESIGKKDFSIEQGGFLAEIDKFDYRYFGITPKDATLMDPNQRIFLETTWRAIEDAGYGGDIIKGTNTGVYVGYCNESPYKQIIEQAEPEAVGMATMGNMVPMIGSRISYLLDLTGPNMLINTACSSSLVALHTACKAIQNKDCSMALVGGVQVHPLPIRKVNMGIESSDNRTKTFDYNANGVSGGEGAIAIMIKSAKRAKQDRDHIYALIKGSSINQDGKAMSLSAPNPEAQERVLTSAWKSADINPCELSYIEAHGTATKLGDSIEIEGITRAFSKYTQKKQFCGIGSVKSNMGHLDAVAGLLGLVKVIASLEKKKIPPTLHYKRPNKSISFVESPVYVNHELRDWEAVNGKRLAGINSFGMSGTNCHLVVEEYQDIQSCDSGQINILALSAKTKTSLLKLLRKYQKVNVRELGLDNVCYTANTGRGHYEYRIIFLVHDAEDYYKKINFVLNHNLEEIKEEEIFYSFCEEYCEESINESDEFYKKNRDQLVKICMAYQTGKKINFEKLYTDTSVHKVSLPYYEFDKTRCWVKYQVQDSLYCDYAWEEAQEANEEKADSNNTHYLVICNHLSDKVTKLVETLKRNTENVEVKVKTYERRMQNYFEELLTAEAEETYNKIIVFLNIGDTSKATEYDEFAEFFEKRYNWLYDLAIGMIKCIGSQKEVVLVSEYGQIVDNSEKTIVPENAAAYALAKVLNIERYPIHCRVIDIDVETPEELIVREIRSNDAEFMVSYRKEKRYVQQLVRLQVEKKQEEHHAIQENATVVVFGGLGNIGRVLCRYLVYKERINLIIVGQTRVPNERYWDNILNAGVNKTLIKKIKILKELKLSGSNIQYETVDICSYKEVEEVINSIRSQYGRISGVFQCTGVGIGMQGSKLSEMDQEVFKEILEAKIYGTWNLNKVFELEEPDYFVALSSPITMTGGVGIGSYGSANAYIESLIDERNKKGNRSYSISLAPWEYTVQNISKEGFDSSKHVFEVLKDAQFVHAVDTILEQPIRKLMVGRLNISSSIFELNGILPFNISQSLINESKERHLRESNVNAMTTLPILANAEMQENGSIEEQILRVFKELLGYSSLSLQDNYYKLGGDSIIAVQISHRLKERLGFDVSSVDILKTPELGELVAILKEQNTKEEKVQLEKEDAIQTSVNRLYRASSAQRRLFLINQNKEVGTTWNITYLMKFIGELNVEKLEEAFQKLIERHEILRTNFIMEKGIIYQQIHDSIDFELQLYKENVKVEDLLEQNTKDVYDITKDVLLRVKLIEENSERYTMLLDISHIISDEMTMELIMSELIQIYNDKELSEMEIQYKDYSEWQNNSIEQGKFNEQKKYWMATFQNKIEKIEFPLDYMRPIQKSFEGKTIYFECEEELTRKVNQLITEKNSTLKWFLLSVFFISLSKYCGKETFIINIPIYGRTFPGSEKLLGMFVNVLPIRNTVDGNITFTEFLDEVKESVINAYANQDYPYERILEDLKCSSDNGQDPFSDICFNMHKMLMRDIQFSNNLKMKPIALDQESSNQDLMMEIYEEEESVKGSIVYCSKLFKESSIMNFIDLYKNVLKQVVDNADILLKEVNLVDNKKITDALELFNSDF